MSSSSNRTAPLAGVTVEQLAEEFLARYRNGQRPAISEYIDRYPNLAEEIRELFPSIVTLESARPESRDHSGGGGAVEPELERLGDFQIIRELGRGGMGIVFEAEQVSLGRRVALKVLPRQAFLNVRQRRRFEREARAAARLHHTNIVPVFGVGEHDGLCYYVMQLISGQGLNEVVRALRELRGGEVSVAPRWSARGRDEGRGKPAPLEFGTGRSAAHLARSLLWNRFEQTMAETQVVAAPGDLNLAGDSTATATPDFQLAADSTLHGGTGGSDSTWSATYWLSVARLGAQVGRALQYAHEQGVVHRDVKPANLLLDTRGQVWVADFGLAKESDQQDLTNTGDVVGTLRYLAPERFNGTADARSDVYALGLSLYELLALRPAFAQRERHRLIRDISDGTPERLRSIDARIPVDLETIVHKAIDRDPAQRYQTAGEFADDIERFIRDEPIRARALSLSSRGVRWCRRNPVVALLSGAVLLLATALVSRLVIENRDAARQRDDYRTGLIQSLESQAKYRRLSGQIGHRAGSLWCLGEAAAMQPSPGLRDEAIRCLALTDLESVAEWPARFASADLDSVDFDQELRRHIAYGDGTIEIRSVPRAPDDAGRLVRSIPAPPGIPRVARFSPDGQSILVRYEDSGRSRLHVFDWGHAVERLAVDDVTQRSLAMDSRGERLACGVKVGDGWRIRVLDLADRRVITEWPVEVEPFDVRFEPSGRRVVVVLPDAYRVVVCDSDTGDVLQSLDCDEDIYTADWSPDGQAVAIGRGYDVTVTWLSEPDKPRIVLKGHRWMVHDVRFHRSGDYLVTHSLREGVSRLWDLRTQRSILSTPGNALGFSENGETLALRRPRSLALLRLVGDREYQMFASNADEEPDAWRVVFHPREPVVIEGGRDGLRCWSMGSRRRIGSTPREVIFTMCFDPRSGELLTAGERGLCRRRIEFLQNGAEARFSDPLPLRLDLPGLPDLTQPALALHITPDGRHLAVRFTQEPAVYSISTTTGRVRRFPCDARMRFLAIRSDGRWIAAGASNGPGYHVWDVEAPDDAGRVLETPGYQAGQVEFSPDGRRLAACANDRFVIYDVETWTVKSEILRNATVRGACTFSGDGQYLALTANTREVQLLDLESFQTVVRFDSDVDTINVLNMEFSPGSSNQLCLACGPSGVRLWDLKTVRKTLSGMGLDW